VRGADFLLAFDDELDVDGQSAVALEETAHSFDLIEHLALVVDGPSRPALAVDDGGLERWRRPLVERVDGLDVMVAVDEGGRGAGAGVQVVAVDGRGTGGLEELDVLEAGVAHQLGGELCRLPHVGGVVGLGRDRRDAQPFEQGLDDALGFGVDVVLQYEFGLRHALHGRGRGVR
jgi:hypothetical protein